MSKIPATHSNEVSAQSGRSVGFAGLGSQGESDATTVIPNERDDQGNPTGRSVGDPGTFAGGAEISQ